ncbi:hypothetical protein M1116_01945 [Patescibacteria group bacterium]|nr:hypothetical protein [Patescibacteria group bacterium]
MVCWCGSEKPIKECHFTDTWTIPSVNGFKISQPPDITDEVKNNLITHIKKTTSIDMVDTNHTFEICIPEQKIEFLKQSLIYSEKITGSNTLSVPPDFVNWGTQPSLSSNFVTDNLKLLSEIKDITEINNFVNFKKYIGHIFFASPASDLSKNLRLVTKKFKEFYPDGYIDFISVDSRNFVLPVIFRSFAKQDILGIDLTKKLINSSWKEKVPLETGSVYFDIMFNLFGDGSYGFVNAWLDRCLLLTFGQRISFKYLSYASAYSKGSDIGFYEGGVDPGMQVFGVSPNDFRQFTAWYIRKLNRLLSYLNHFATFANRVTSFIDPVAHYKYYLTWEQILILVAKILGTDDRTVKKQLTFVFLDIMAHLKGGLIDHLFKPRILSDILNSFNDLPNSLSSKYRTHAEIVFNNLIDEVYSGVIPQFAVNDKVVLPSGKEFDKFSYVGAYLSALRNTIHGYSGSTDEEYKEVMFINKGEIPTRLAEIVPILFMYLLIKPDVFFKSNIFSDIF